MFVCSRRLPVGLTVILLVILLDPAFLSVGGDVTDVRGFKGMVSGGKHDFDKIASDLTLRAIIPSLLQLDGAVRPPVYLSCKANATSLFVAVRLGSSFGRCAGGDLGWHEAAGRVRAHLHDAAEAVYRAPEARRVPHGGAARQQQSGFASAGGTSGILLVIAVALYFFKHTLNRAVCS